MMLSVCGGGDTKCGEGRDIGNRRLLAEILGWNEKARCCEAWLARQEYFELLQYEQAEEDMLPRCTLISYFCLNNELYWIVLGFLR
jgi:hypothetical protein